MKLWTPHTPDMLNWESLLDETQNFFSFRLEVQLFLFFNLCFWVNCLLFEACIFSIVLPPQLQNLLTYFNPKYEWCTFMKISKTDAETLFLLFSSYNVKNWFWFPFFLFCLNLRPQGNNSRTTFGLHVYNKALWNVSFAFQCILLHCKTCKFCKYTRMQKKNPHPIHQSSEFWSLRTPGVFQSELWLNALPSSALTYSQTHTRCWQRVSWATSFTT